MVEISHSHAQTGSYETPALTGRYHTKSPFKIVRILDYIIRAHHNPLTVFTNEYFKKPVLERRYFGATYLHVFNPDLIEYVLNKEANKFNFDYLRKAVFKPVIGDGLLVSEGSKAAGMRKVLMPLFRSLALKGLGPLICEPLASHLGRLSKQDDEPVDIARALSWTTMDVLNAYIFSNDDSMDTKAFSEIADELFSIHAKPHIADMLQLTRFLPKFLRIKHIEQTEQLRAIMSALVDNRQLSLPNSYLNRDLLDYILEASDDESLSLSESDVIDNLLTFISAGHQTVTNSLTWCMFMVAKHPLIQHQIRQEIADACLSPRQTHSWATQLPYLSACIKETLRLYPAVALISRYAKRSLEYKDLTIKAGTTVHICPWVLHRHHTLWDEPNRFNPSRFMPEHEKDIPKNAYLPFGAGARRCISQQLAVEIMTVTMAGLIDRFDVQYCGTDDPKLELDLCVRPSEPIMLKLKPRIDPKIIFSA